MSSLKHLTVQANGIRMHVAEQGDGPVVLLCHGFPETWYAWRHQLPALAGNGFRAVAPDLRGYGATERPADAGQYSLFHLVGDMVGLLDALGAETAVIVGNDWGATLAWQAALLRPDRFRAVVASSVPMMTRSPLPPGKLFPATDDALFYTLYFQEPGVAEREFERDVRLTLRKLIFGASGDAGARVDGDGTPNPFRMVTRRDGLLAPLPAPESLPAWITEADLDVYAEAFAASGFGGALNWYRNLDRNWELQAALDGLTVRVPALYVVGERDVGLSIPGMRQIMDGMPALVPHLRDTVVIPEAGHWIQQEKPEEYNAALLAFLRTL
ncbi:alpha/beta fold hydrolase [Longimicrobium terrae]|uniref:Pimeloyl-ACP methyl ester carboxylesterase n=1 Tax=Longimicrobium terrae TaxID=1639882 RepID=A0A841H3F8_9BACT|nr:alpha/beta hydrolase [Longimicrobium terrae]MBB4638110.1 pimeloyl-ACP methyl ester carboxylesterase [Longimicrobium terrae]MBB6072482.1 pimeloyl-ACP methyl ester carboxylesterase [Longimicrobium terrae]NNC32107.1 alpha/beta hydrolase [Longimicrobium terrae]